MIVRAVAVVAIVGAASTVAALFAAGSATAVSAPSLTCGVNPTASVVLTSDLTCTGSFVVGGATDSGPIVIDLGGHTLAVTAPDEPCILGQPPATPPMCAIFGESVVKITNGTVLGGVGLASQSDRGRLINATVQGDVWLSGAGGLVSRSTIDHGTINARGAHNDIEWNVIRAGGVTFDDSATGMTTTIADNRISASPGAGVQGVVGGGGEFENDVVGQIIGNHITGATGAGIDLSGALSNFGAFAVSGNEVSANTGDGIHIAGVDDPPTPFVGGPVTVAANTAIANGGQGIHAEWVSNLSGSGIVDGGGNVARRNQADPQCSGVVCALAS